MIRFCNREEYSITCSVFDKKKLLNYFSDKKDNVVCVCDEITGEFLGKITYYDLSSHDNIREILQREYVFLNKDVWENGRNYFFNCKRKEEIILLPVVNEKKEVVCFAYEDNQANRELRMLRELNLYTPIFSFKDIYPQYETVTIHGCNELGYYFARYLKKQNISVKVTGKQWEYIGYDNSKKTKEYKNMTVYAEGTWQKSFDLREDISRTVSVEFECIDHIYEACLKEGYIKDQDGDMNEVFAKLRKGAVAVIGTGIESQSVYNYLLGNEIEIVCFVSDYAGHRSLFGEKIYGFSEVVKIYTNCIFIECSSRNSTWGLGNVDWYDYRGYHRNVGYFMIRDYIDVPLKLDNVLKDRNVFFVGEPLLCKKVFRCTQEYQYKNIGYYNILGHDVKNIGMSYVERTQIDSNSICLLCICKNLKLSVDNEYRNRQEEYYVKLQERGFQDCVCDFFSYDKVSVEIETKAKTEKFTVPELIPKGILIGVTAHGSGNLFFRSLLDSHPNIISIDYSTLNDHLYTICIQLAEVASTEVEAEFWKIYDVMEDIGDLRIGLKDRSQFGLRLNELLKLKRSFTSQELFVMLHIAYVEMWKREKVDINNMIIYWEPHGVKRQMCEEQYAEWLDTKNVNDKMIEITRDSISRAGSWIKTRITYKGGLEKNLYISELIEALIYYKGIKREGIWEKIAIKFEDIKAFPIEVLSKFCENLDIPWQDSLLQTTFHGETTTYSIAGKYNVISGFDMKPVVNTYDEYFTGFDKLRIGIINSLWQKRYHYPYISCSNYSRRDLQELFRQKFMFEEFIVEEEHTKKKQNFFWEFLDTFLWEVRQVEVMGYDVGEYYKE